jgi:Divergent InlB B-repeat domain
VIYTNHFTATPNNFFPIGTYFYMIPIDLRSNGKTAFVQPCQYIDPSTGNVEVKFAVYEPIKPMSLVASVSVSENGSGTVTSSPAGINCSNGSGACSANVAFGTQVTLSATAASGLVFAGWSGAGCSGTGGCTLTALSAESVTATFAQSAYTLSVSETGSGAVTSSPPLINCVDSGRSCSASFAIGTQVSLTETPASGFSFAGWGGVCGGTGTCTVTMSAAESVSASFSQAAPPTSPLAAVLPSSRSATVNNPVTAFATIINSGGSAAPACAIAAAGGLPLAFAYQTTNPTTNALTGTVSTPIDIPARQAQSFVIALTPSSAFDPTNLVLSFACTNVAPAPVDIGLDTLLLSASTSPVPDIVALVATASNDGILHIPGSSGSNAFAVATVDVGSAGTITAGAKTPGTI